MHGLVLALLFLASLPNLAAADGVLEINETCAKRTGCFPGDTPGFPVTIDGSAGRSYRLTGDLVVPVSSDFGDAAILISTNDVSIDLSGFSIISTGCASNPSVACRPPSESASRSGVAVDSIFSRYGNSVRNGSVVGMSSSGVLLGKHSEIADVRARWNTVIGIGARDGSLITRSVAFENQRGISAGPGSTVSSNSAYGNTSEGISAAAGSTVAGNSATANEGDGILMSGAGSVFDNTVQGNGGDGIDCTSGGRSYVRGNSALQNAGLGLNLADPAPDPDAIYRDNVIYDNGAGTVVGGTDRGGNSCRGASGPITDCP